MSLPTGTVTFLFTDIEGSTKLWEAQPDAMRVALARHDSLLRGAIERNNGYVFKTVGDAFCAAFHTASDGLNAAMEAQLGLAGLECGEIGSLRVRMGIHTGSAEERDSDYFGPALNCTSRLQSAAHGQQTLLSLVTAELVRSSLPPDAALCDLGLHRLRDLAAPEHVWQINHPGMPSNFPPLKSLDYLPTNLPQQLTSFIGREKEMAEIAEMMSKTRLLTLTGSGGTGKTRLSLQAGAEVMEHYSDGVWFVELAPLADPSLVPQTVADVVGVREAMGEPITQKLLSALRDKQILLVLDNCEHVLAASAHLTDAILRGCPKVKVLVSSREALGIGGERAYRVPSLSLPDANASCTPETLFQYETVRLFIDRAVAARADFSVTSDNAAALASVCRRLDGIPLAIELAAARARSLSVEEINARLDQRFRLLTGGSRTALPRQQTLRSLIDWSYDLLNEPEKTLLCRLSVLAGGWELEAAESVGAGEGTEDWDTLDLLTSLADKSLVATDQNSGITRYRLLETVRQYARDRLAESGESDAVRERHRDYFLKLAEEAVLKLMGSEQAKWLQRLEDEHENLRAALDWSLISWEEADPGAPQHQISNTEYTISFALRLCGAMSRFWSTRGHLSEGREWCERALGSFGAQERTTERAKTLNTAGILAYSQGEFASAWAYHEEALVIRREIGDRLGIASSVNNMGNVAINQGDYASARACHEEALAIRREIGDRLGIAASLNNLGNVSHEQGNYGSARAYHIESLAIWREIGERIGVAGSLNNLGNIAYDQVDYLSARTYHEESLAIRREMGDRSGIATSLSNLGNVAGAQGDHTSALDHHKESLAIKREIGDRNGLATSLEAFAGHAAIENGFVRAAVLWGAAAALREEIGSPLPPNEISENEKQVDDARAALGDDAVFDAAWAEGRGMTMEEACELALGRLAIGVGR